MPPPKIMIIRHAEKPLSGKPYGLRENGTIDKESLTTRGWQRAGALARFFAPVSGELSAPALSTPTLIAASRVNKKGGGASRRPKQTVTPLAELLGLKIDLHYSKGREAAIMKKMLTKDGVVLIAWEHEHIPALVARMPDAPAVPQQWPGDRFDLVWIFEPRSEGGWTFDQVPQRVLAGDQDSVIPLP